MSDNLEDKKPVYKKWWFWAIIILGVIIVCLIGIVILSAIGFNNLSNEKEQQLIRLKDENNKIQSQFSDLTERITNLQKDEEQKKINEKISELKEEQKNLEEEVKDKKSEKTSLEKDLKKLNGDIITAKGKAKSYPAGQLVAGEDFEVGRYKIYGGNSNFVVRSEWGDLEVNIILGDWGVDEYIYKFSKGDEIEARSSFKMQPIE